MDIEKEQRMLFKKMAKGDRFRRTLYQRKIKATIEAIGWNIRQLLNYLEGHDPKTIVSSLTSLRDVRQLMYNVVIHLNRLRRMHINTEVEIELKMIGFWIRQLENTIDCVNIKNLVIDVTTSDTFLGFHYRKLVKIINPIINN